MGGVVCGCDRRLKLRVRITSVRFSRAPRQVRQVDEPAPLRLLQNLNIWLFHGNFPSSIVAWQPLQVPVGGGGGGPASSWTSSWPDFPTPALRTSTAERRPTRQMTSAARLTCAASVFSTQVVIVDTLPCAGRRQVPVSEATAPLPSLPLRKDGKDFHRCDYFTSTSPRVAA